MGRYHRHHPGVPGCAVVLRSHERSQPLRDRWPPATARVPASLGPPPGGTGFASSLWRRNAFVQRASARRCLFQRRRSCWTPGVRSRCARICARR